VKTLGFIKLLLLLQIISGNLPKDLFISMSHITKN